MSVTYADMSQALSMDMHDEAVEGDGYAWPEDAESPPREDNAFVGLIGQSPSIQKDVELARKIENKARASQQPQQHHDSRLPNGRTALARGVSFESDGLNGESAGRDDEPRRTISSNSTSELSFQNETLRKENQQLSAEVKRLAESTSNGSAPAAPSENNSEGRLRRALTTKGTTTAELRQAIQSVEAMVEEARRELDRAMLRERRAAYEALYNAIDRGDEEILELAIEKARLAEVQIEDLTKGEAKLADLRAMSPEQKAKKLATELESKRKKEAFILIKRDDTEALTALLESLNEDVQWRNWRDYAGRSLWKCALDLRATRVQFYLAPLVGQRLPEEHALANGKRASVRPSLMLPAGLSGSFTSEDGKRPSIGSPSNSRLYPNGMGGSRGSLLSTGSGSARPGGESPTGGSPSLLAQAPPLCVRQISETEVLGNDLLLLPATPDLDLGVAALAESQLNGSHASSESPARSVTGSVPSPDRNEAQETKLRMQAFRSVAQDDCDSLAEVLQSVHQDIWTKWMNKAGKDLLTLSTERGSDMAYSMLARELGMLKEAHRESFEERESVWVFEQGEVQPRRATVIEDTTAEEEQVLLEFWDGDDPPEKVDRCLIHKMYS